MFFQFLYNLGNIFSINWKLLFKNHWYFNNSILYSDEHYNDWIFHTYTYNYNENNNVIKVPLSREFIIEFGNNPSSKYSFNYQLNMFNNSLLDSRLEQTLNTYVKVSNFFTIDFGVLISNSSNKYNFLKVRKIINNNESNEGEIFVSNFIDINRENEQEKIYF